PASNATPRKADPPPISAGPRFDQAQHVGLAAARAVRPRSIKEAPAVGDLTAGALSRRSIVTAMRVNRDSQKLMRERPAHNYRRLKFFRCDISAKANPRRS